MKLTIGSEAVFFLALIVSYLYFWRTGNFEKEVLTHLHPKTTGLFTAVLLTSSFTFWRAEKNHSKDDYKGVKRWLIATVLLGSVFLAGQAHEYYNLIQDDVLISKTEFGSSFYTLTGFHGVHVLVGLLILIILLILLYSGYLHQSKSQVLSAVGIYWHFVDAVWLSVFIIIYLLPYLI